MTYSLLSFSFRKKYREDITRVPRLSPSCSTVVLGFLAHAYSLFFELWILLFAMLQSERFFNALKGHGALCRLVILPYESHSYSARESIMHVLWETDRWLQKYCAPNTSELSTDVDAVKKQDSEKSADLETKVTSASGGGVAEVDELEHGVYSHWRSLLW